MLDLHVVSKTCDPNVNMQLAQWRIRLSFRAMKCRLSVRRMCSVHCSIEEGDHNEDGKQLNFIQPDAGLLSLLYSMYSAGSVTL